MEPLKLGRMDIILDLDEINVDSPIDIVDGELNLFKVGGLDSSCRWSLNQLLAPTLFPFMKVEYEVNESDAQVLDFVKTRLTDDTYLDSAEEPGFINKFYTMKIIKNPRMVDHYYIVIVLKKGFLSLQKASPSRSALALTQEALRLLYEVGTVDCALVKHYLAHLREFNLSRNHIN